MNVREIDGAIEEFVARSEELRQRVAKRSVSRPLRHLLRTVLASSQADADVEVGEMQQAVSDLRVEPAEVLLEAIRSVRLDARSILAVSLDRHHEYYQESYFDGQRPSYLSVSVMDLRRARGAQSISASDALFHVVLQSELGSDKCCDALPMSCDGLVYGWILLAPPDVRVEGSHTWPEIPRAKGVLQTETRWFREVVHDKLLEVANPRRVLALLESGLDAPRSLYLSDPVYTSLPSTSKRLGKIALQWREEFGRVGQSSRDGGTARCDGDKPRIAVQPCSTSDPLHELLWHQTRELARRVAEARKRDLPKLVVKDLRNRGTLEEITWKAASETTGWRIAVQLSRSEAGRWTWNRKKKGDRFPTRLPLESRSGQQQIEEDLVQIADLAMAKDERSSHIASGGFLQGWGHALAVPSALFRPESAPSYLLLMTDRSKEWVHKAARNVEKQLEIANQTVGPSAAEHRAIRILRQIHKAGREIRLNGPHWVTHSLCSCRGTPYATFITKLDKVLSDWKPGTKDVIIVRGESRSGKNFVVSELLKKRGFVEFKRNWEHFVKPTEPLKSSLEECLRASRVAIVMDEVPTGESTRPLLGLLEKKDDQWRKRFPGLQGCLLCVTTSANPLLPDLLNRSKSEYTLNAPGLNTHWQDIPYIVARQLFDRGYTSISEASLLAFLMNDWESVSAINALCEKVPKAGASQQRLEHLALPKTLRIPHWPSLECSTVRLLE